MQAPPISQRRLPSSWVGIAPIRGPPFPSKEHSRKPDAARCLRTSRTSAIVVNPCTSMSKASMHSFKLGRTRPFTQIIDKSTIIPILACVYSIVVSPLLIFLTAGAHNPLTGTFETRHENKIVWPAMAAISVVLVVRYRSRIGTLLPHIICLLAYLAFAGASVLWAFRPELSFIRYAQQVMVVTSIVLPAMLAVRKSDMMRALYLCLAFASILNLFFVLGGSQTIVNKAAVGYSGYFGGKNYLGEFAAVALLAVTSRNALSRTPACIGQYRCCRRRFARGFK